MVQLGTQHVFESSRCIPSRPGDLSFAKLCNFMTILLKSLHLYLMVPLYQCLLAQLHLFPLLICSENIPQVFRQLFCMLSSAHHPYLVP